MKMIILLRKITRQLEEALTRRTEWLLWHYRALNRNERLTPWWLDWPVLLPLKLVQLSELCRRRVI